MDKKKKKGAAKRKKDRLSGLAAENMCLWMLISREDLLDEAREFLQENMDLAERSLSSMRQVCAL